MNDATQPSANSSTAAANFGAELSAAFARQTASWIEDQRELLSSAGTIMTGWLDRQREAIGLSGRSLQRVWECRNLIDLVQAQQQWASECLRWTVAELRAAGRDADTLTQKATARLCEGTGQAAESWRRESSRRRQAAEAESARPAAAE
jgi:hypothetical protein